YGRRRGGKIADNVGFNTYVLRDSDALHGEAGVQIARTEETYRVACTQEHQSLNVKETGGDRGIIRSASFAEYQKDPNAVVAKEDVGEHENESMWPPYKYEGHAWGMVIDTTVCIGCNGCVVACQSENNISVVGKEEVLREREMHWLRIVRYFRGDVANPEVYNQPVPCMQCENAPCEPVC